MFSSAVCHHEHVFYCLVTTKFWRNKQTRTEMTLNKIKVSSM